MNLKLRVLRGASVGKEFGIPTPKCVIGRHQACDLRPKSDAISRQHCAVFVRSGRVFVRDLKSRNGTFLNGQRVLADCEVQSGDRLQIGPLMFEICVDQASSGETSPVVASAWDAAESARNASPARHVSEARTEESTIVDWLDEADDLERVRRLNDAVTRHMKLEETDEIEHRQVSEPGNGERQNVQSKAGVGTPLPTKAAAPNEELHKPPRTVGKLPPRPVVSTEDSSEAAALMLKKFFGGRS